MITAEKIKAQLCLYKRILSFSLPVCPLSIFADDDDSLI